MNEDQFEKLFNSFQSSVFRLELLQRYRVEDEQELLDRHLSGELVNPSFDDKWSEFVRQCQKNGKTVERLRVVHEPLSPYVQFELEWGYVPGCRAGEIIKVVRNQKISSPDFWLFDNKNLAVMHYTDDGEYVDVEITDDSERVGRAMEVRDQLAKFAIDLTDYLSMRRKNLLS